jgi:hypothetical protein
MPTSQQSQMRLVFLIFSRLSLSGPQGNDSPVTPGLISSIYVTLLDPFLNESALRSKAVGVIDRVTVSLQMSAAEEALMHSIQHSCLSLQDASRLRIGVSVVGLQRVSRTLSVV